MTRLLLSLSALLLITLSLPASTLDHAYAAGTSTYTTKLLTGTLRASEPSYSSVLRLPDLTLEAGDAMLLVAKLAATSNVPRGPMIGARIICPGGGGSTYTTRNHIGRAHGVKRVTVRWLFVPPKDGIYRCELRGLALTMLDPETAVLKLVSGETRLEATQAHIDSAEWGDTDDSCVGSMAIRSIEQCSSPTKATTVVRRSVPVGRAYYVTVMGDIELSREYGGYPGGDSTIRLSLRATPTDADGRSCAPTRETSIERRISGTLHHVKPILTLSDVRVNQSGSCGQQLRVRVRARWLKGNPVTLHNSVYSGAIVLIR